MDRNKEKPQANIVASSNSDVDVIVIGVGTYGEDLSLPDSSLQVSFVIW